MCHSCHQLSQMHTMNYLPFIRKNTTYWNKILRHRPPLNPPLWSTQWIHCDKTRKKYQTIYSFSRASVLFSLLSQTWFGNQYIWRRSSTSSNTLLVFYIKCAWRVVKCAPRFDLITLMERKLPCEILNILIQWFSISVICVKWNGYASHFFRLL